LSLSSTSLYPKKVALHLDQRWLGYSTKQLAQATLSVIVTGLLADINVRLVVCLLYQFGGAGAAQVEQSAGVGTTARNMQGDPAICLKCIFYGQTLTTSEGPSQLFLPGEGETKEFFPLIDVACETVATMRCDVSNGHGGSGGF